MLINLMVLVGLLQSPSIVDVIKVQIQFYIPIHGPRGHMTLLRMHKVIISKISIPELVSISNRYHKKIDTSDTFRPPLLCFVLLDFVALITILPWTTVILRGYGTARVMS